MPVAAYDPFGAGPLGVDVRPLRLTDSVRGRTFPGSLWVPSPGGARGVGPLPAVAFSHYSGGDHRSAAYLCAHLASSGYLVAAMDHSETLAPELAARPGESPAERAVRVEAVVGSRVPDARLLLDRLLDGSLTGDAVAVDGDRVGLVGHSFGGWTALATAEADDRVRAVVALAPGGAANPRPGILPLTLALDWRREVATLILTGEDDVLTPLDGIRELYDRVPHPKRLAVLRRADHLHFVDDVAGAHEGLRTAQLSEDAAWMGAAMRPIEELCPAEEAHAFTRGLTLAHFDAALRGLAPARALLVGDVARVLAARGVAAVMPEPALIEAPAQPRRAPTRCA
jgi:dienelactone hydrolase